MGLLKRLNGAAESLCVSKCQHQVEQVKDSICRKHRDLEIWCMTWHCQGWQTLHTGSGELGGLMLNIASQIIIDQQWLTLLCQ